MAPLCQVTAGAQSRLQTLSSLADRIGPDAAAPDATMAVFAALSAATGGALSLSVGDTSRLLAFEHCNAYGIMALGGDEASCFWGWRTRTQELSMPNCCTTQIHHSSASS